MRIAGYRMAFLHVANWRNMAQSAAVLRTSHYGLKSMRALGRFSRALPDPDLCRIGFGKAAFDIGAAQ